MHLICVFFNNRYSYFNNRQLLMYYSICYSLAQKISKVIMKLTDIHNFCSLDFFSQFQ